MSSPVGGADCRETGDSQAVSYVGSVHVQCHLPGCPCRYTTIRPNEWMAMWQFALLRGHYGEKEILVPGGRDTDEEDLQQTIDCLEELLVSGKGGVLVVSTCGAT